VRAIRLQPPTPWNAPSYGALLSPAGGSMAAGRVSDRPRIGCLANRPCTGHLVSPWARRHSRALPASALLPRRRHPLDNPAAWGSAARVLFHCEHNIAPRQRLGPSSQALHGSRLTGRAPNIAIGGSSPATRTSTRAAALRSALSTGEPRRSRSKRRLHCETATRDSPWRPQSAACDASPPAHASRWPCPNAHRCSCIIPKRSS